MRCELLIVRLSHAVPISEAASTSVMPAAHMQLHMGLIVWGKMADRESRGTSLCNKEASGPMQLPTDPAPCRSYGPAWSYTSLIMTGKLTGYGGREQQKGCPYTWNFIRNFSTLIIPRAVFSEIAS
jgi:hypothetical protein